MRKIIRFAILVSSAVALQLVTACATITQGIQTPAISLESVRLTDANLTRQTFMLGFTVDNPNSIPIPISSIGYALNFAGQTFATGATAESFTLPANGQGNFKARVETNLVDSARSLSQMILVGGQRELEYDLSGDVNVDLPFVRSLPFRQSGVVSLQR